MYKMCSTVQAHLVPFKSWHLLVVFREMEQTLGDESILERNITSVRGNFPTCGTVFAASVVSFVRSAWRLYVRLSPYMACPCSGGGLGCPVSFWRCAQQMALAMGNTRNTKTSVVLLKADCLGLLVHLQICDRCMCQTRGSRPTMVGSSFLSF